MRSGNNRDGSVFCRWSGWKRCPPCQLDSPANAVWRHGTVWGTKAKPSAWNTDGFAVPRTSGIVTLTALSGSEAVGLGGQLCYCWLPTRRLPGQGLTRDEARRIAANIVKLPELYRKLLSDQIVMSAGGP